jgi:hypothetical protein
MAPVHTRKKHDAIIWCICMIMTCETQCAQRCQRRQPSPSSTLMEASFVSDNVNCSSSHQRQKSAHTPTPSSTSIHKPKATTQNIEPYIADSASATLSSRAKPRGIQAALLDALYAKCGQCWSRDRGALLAASPARAGLRRSYCRKTRSPSLEGSAEIAPRGWTLK